MSAQAARQWWKWFGALADALNGEVQFGAKPYSNPTPTTPPQRGFFLRANLGGWLPICENAAQRRPGGTSPKELSLLADFPHAPRPDGGFDHILRSFDINYLIAIAQLFS